MSLFRSPRTTFFYQQVNRFESFFLNAKMTTAFGDNTQLSCASACAVFGIFVVGSFSIRPQLKRRCALVNHTSVKAFLGALASFLPAQTHVLSCKRTVPALTQPTDPTCCLIFTVPFIMTDIAFRVLFVRYLFNCLI